MTKQEKIKEILRRLYSLYPEPKTALQYSTPLELLIATMLSAQTTDKLVNTVTPTLFARYKTASEYASAAVEEIDELIRKVNFHRTKAKNIQAMAQMLEERFEGEVPNTLAELVQLPGVARKTAGVVLGNIYGKAENIVVDTHVIRLSRLLGLTQETAREKIEQDLMKIVPRENWIDFTHLLINYGREYCPARKHDHSNCPLRDLYV